MDIFYLHAKLRNYFASKKDHFARTEQSPTVNVLFLTVNILSLTENILPLTGNILSPTINILPGLSRLLDLHRPTSTQRLPQVQCSPFNRVVGGAFKSSPGSRWGT